MEKTSLPVYNELLDKADRYLEGHLEPEVVEQALTAVEQTFEALWAQFYDGLQFQEEHPALDELVPLVHDELATLFALREPLREALAHSDATAARELLQEGSHSLRELFGLFGRIKEALPAREPVSEIPAVDELARVVEAFLRGGLEEEAVHQRLAQFADFHQSLLQGLSLLQPTGPEQTAFDPEELRGALDQQEEAVVLLDTAMHDQNGALLRQGVDTLLAAARRLVVLQQRLDRANQEEPSRPCLRCSTPNPLTSRYCSACQAVLPEVVPHQSPSVIAVEGAESAPGLPENLQILVESAELLRDGRLDRMEFHKTLDWLRQNLEKGRAGLAAIAPASPDTPPEQADALHQARQALEEGMTELEEGLDMLAGYLDRPDPGLLDRGLTLARGGAERMMEVQAIWVGLVGQPSP